MPASVNPTNNDSRKSQEENNDRRNRPFQAPNRDLGGMSNDHQKFVRKTVNDQALTLILFKPKLGPEQPNSPIINARQEVDLEIRGQICAGDP